MLVGAGQPAPSDWRVRLNYEAIVEDSVGQLRTELTAQMADPAFQWEQLIEAILLEDSPLQEVFNPRTLRLARLAEQSHKLVAAARALGEETSEALPSIEDEPNDRTPEPVSATTNDEV